MESVVDALIEAMKLRRASTAKNSPSVRTVQEMVVAPKNGNEFSSNAVMESALDVLIEAMKLRRASVME